LVSKALLCKITLFVINDFIHKDKNMTQCTENYRVGVVPLAFDIVSTGTRLVGNTIVDIDQHINKTLESKEFQDALKKAVREHQNRMFFDDLKGKHRSPEEAEKEKLNAILKATKNAGGSVIQSSIMQTPTGQQLKQELQAFKREFECSPTGVWIDENKTTLIVVGALGLVGGSFYMYKNRTGDTIGTIGENLLKKTWVVGSVNLETKVTKLKPSARELGVSAALSYKWRGIKTKVAVNAFGHEKLADISTLGTITLPLATNLSAGLGVNHSTKNIPLTKNTSADTLSDFNAFLKLQYVKDKVSLQLNAAAGSSGEYSVGAILHVEF
jgi:hypothetical protein